MRCVYREDERYNCSLPGALVQTDMHYVIEVLYDVCKYSLLHDPGVIGVTPDAR